MSAPRKSTAPRKGKAVGKPTGREQIPLITPIPGGLARWRKPTDLTPRRTRELEAIGGELLPRLGQIMRASTLSVGGTVVDTSTVLDGTPVGLGRDEIRSFMEFQEACAWAYLESWTLADPLPDGPDAFQDLARPLYDALMAHASKLAMANNDADFSVTSLPDEGEADPDLPT